jgi:PAS domain S-box-containing protein
MKAETVALFDGSFGDDVPEILDEATLKEAHALLDHLSHALFPPGDIPNDLMTWADSFASSNLDASAPRSIEERLRAAEKRFVTLVEQIPAVTFMAVLGEGDNEVYVSPHIEQMLGYSQEEWLSDPFLWYTRLHPEDRKLWNDEFADGCRRGGPFRAECRFLARDGHVVWVHGEARLVKDEKGRPQFLQGVAFDITESKRAQQMVLEAAVRTAKVREELEIARRVQTSILPNDPKLEGLEIAAIMIPADEVGGDYYDVRPALNGGWLAIGDVSGHGLDAGLVMLMVQSATFAISSARVNVSPSELLTLLNEVLYDNIARRLARSDYVTLSVLRYTKNGHVEFAGAHQDLLVYRARTHTVERIRTPGPWVGIRKHIRTITTDGSFDLRDGDVLVLFTDGVVEAMNEENEQFDVDRLCQALQEVHAESPDYIRDHIVQKVRRWMVQQDDDITLLVARYAPNKPREVEGLL